MHRLVTAARAARAYARARFSDFAVGAAVEDEHGRVFTGCNIESASYGLTICAERVAVFKAVSEGAGKLKHMALVADSETLVTPCGACRQILWEFCGGGELILANLVGREESVRIASLFPRPFDASLL
ncbi:MAG TPA: cytidine deaminase [Bryobacteraceae bacterium]